MLSHVEYLYNYKGSENVAEMGMERVRARGQKTVKGRPLAETWGLHGLTVLCLSERVALSKIKIVRKFIMKERGSQDVPPLAGKQGCG